MQYICKLFVIAALLFAQPGNLLRHSQQRLFQIPHILVGTAREGRVQMQISGV